MAKNLVIVESPAKAKTIEKFLGKSYKVKSCNGHVRDLLPNKLSIKLEKNFEPEYSVLPEKQKLIRDIKESRKGADMIWLATDEDREGEAISWHLAQLLGLKEENYKRIVFHEITKNAILKAIENPRTINQDLVNAQQARRVLDRLVGFQVSPILWKKVKPALSAGRVQSVAVRLIVEREREVLGFIPESAFRVTARFETDKKAAFLDAELNKKFKMSTDAKAFLSDCIDAVFQIHKVEKKEFSKSPAPPFTTSTLQQEANRKLGYSVGQTMRLSQTLYESGYITYMRTDSVKLSNFALAALKNTITHLFGEKYSKTRNFDTKSKSAQEAHEAIRPTYMENQHVDADPQAQKLYELIWKRTIASQMSNALVERTSVNITMDNNPNIFSAKGEVIVFDGFLKLYIESNDDENGEDNREILPPVKEGDILTLHQCLATERFSRPPARYSEAALVKKMEELGIGRPSTYAPTISTIMKREYVTKDFKEGNQRNYLQLSLKKGQIREETLTEKYGAEKNKLFPSSTGMIVNDFLFEHFPGIVDYHFTANIENEFDDIASGKKNWSGMIAAFYKDFEPLVKSVSENAQRTKGERTLGTDPVTGEKVFAKLGRYGPFVQLGEKENDKKPKFATLKKGQLIENITLEEALHLLKLPRDLGVYNKQQVLVNIGRFGPYVMYEKKFYSIPKTEDPYEISLEKAIEIIELKNQQEKNKTVHVYDHENKSIKVLRGRYGPYISYDGNSYKIPKGQDPEKIQFEEVLSIIKNTKPAQSKRGSARKKTAKK